MNQNASRLFGIVVLVVLVNQPISEPARATDGADRMTCAQAKARIPQRQLPGFWVGDVKGPADRFERLTRGTVRVVAISPGGRPIHLITYGDKEPLPQKANFNSAIGGRLPGAFNLTSALYHRSGATSFTFECPHGLKGSCEVTHEQILDIQLTLYEAMLHHELDKKK